MGMCAYVHGLSVTSQQLFSWSNADVQSCWSNLLRALCCLKAFPQMSHFNGLAFLWMRTCWVSACLAEKDCAQ